MESLLRFAREARESLTPLLTASAFESAGMLTASEFVQAGDTLVLKSPCWSWSAGLASHAREYLPKDKQFLINTGAHCRARAFEVDVNEQTEAGNGVVGTESKEADAGAGWHLVSDATQAQAAAKAPSGGGGSSSSDNDLLDTSVLPDLGSVFIDRAPSRTYDLSIVFDNYYRTPRLFFAGFDASGAPLSQFACFQDCVTDYVKKTVTVERHPHLGTSLLSVHPCQHAATMKKMLAAQAKACGTGRSTVKSEHYLFVFLKFISAVIPTIEFDHTMDLQGVGRK